MGTVWHHSCLPARIIGALDDNAMTARKPRQSKLSRFVDGAGAFQLRPSGVRRKTKFIDLRQPLRLAASARLWGNRRLNPRLRSFYTFCGLHKTTAQTAKKLTPMTKTAFPSSSIPLFWKKTTMKSVKSAAAAALASLSLLVMGAPASAQQAGSPLVIKFSHVVAPNTPKGKGADRFKELAESYTQGRVKVEVYPNSQLYKDNEEMNALQLGAVQILAPSLAKFGPLGVREFELFDLPYIFQSNEDLRKITDGEVGRKLLDKLESTGIRGLAYWDNGFKVMSANTPVHTPDDMLGLKMRIQSSKVLEAQMMALDAVPQVMAFSEVYQARQTGVVDGTENPPSNMYTQKMHEVQKHATLTYHGYLGYAVITNKAFWDGLPEDIRAALEKAMKEATDYANAITQQQNDEALAEMRKAGTTNFYQPSEAERDEWIKQLLPVHKEVSGRIGKDTLKEVYQALGR